MSETILKVDNIAKQYRLGTVGTGTIGHDLNRWWHKVRGKEDPYLKVGAINDRSAQASSDYVWALRDISFEVKKGEVLGIIGKNGAGKSTLLKILSRVTSPTLGSIKTKGRIASLLEVGTGMHPELTGRENVYLNGAILGMTKAEIRAKIDEIVEFSGCQMYIDTPVKRYSSGMRVRLGFAVAAFLEPDILVVDEVLAVGDADFQKKAIGKMQDISTGGGRTVLFVSHNMGSIQSLCTRAILLENGEVICDGDVEKTVSTYLKSSKENVNDYSNVVDRKGRGNIQITDIFLTNSEKKVEYVKLGEFIAFNLDLVVREHPKYSKFKVLIGVYNAKDEGIMRFDSSATDDIAIEKFGNKLKLSCHLDDHITLMPGQYFANFAIYADGVLEDYLAGKFVFDIVNDNYLGSTKTLDNDNLAKVLIKHHWELKE